MSLFHITRQSGIPLVGCIYFGVVDRGSSLLQIRPSCGCNLNCPFCSVDAGPHSRSRVTDYQVELDYLMEAVEEIAPFKGPGVECHIDSPGEPMLYPDIVPLVERLKAIKEVSVVSMQSNGTLLDEERIRALEEAGLDRINLSIHSLQPEKAAFLAGMPGFDIEKIKQAAKSIAAKQDRPYDCARFDPGHQRRGYAGADPLRPGDRCGKEVAAPGHSEVRALPAGPLAGQGQGPELVAILQSQHEPSGRSSSPYRFASRRRTSRLRGGPYPHGL